MRSIINNAAPNVVPGTNFNTKRFEELFAWITSLSADGVRSGFALNQYGLLVSYDGKSSLQLEKTGDKLTLRRCSGVTPAGGIIGIFEGHTPAIEAQLDQLELDSKKQYYVLVEIENAKRTPFGPEAEDSPQRPQFSMSSYRLHIQDVEQVLGSWANALPIGHLTYESGDWNLAEYIPPCTHIGANEILCEKYREYQEAFKIMLNAQPNIIRQTDTFRDKSMIELREFTLHCGSFLASRQPNFNTLTEIGRPTHLIETWLAFANLVTFLMNCLTDRPGFYNLLYQNTKSVNGVMFTTERLDAALDNLKNHTYNHQNILKTIKAIDEFLTLMVPMFKALGNGTLRPIGNNYEEVYKVQETKPKQSHTTW